ncbi:MAG: hypothetical protein ABIQ73_19865 [Acidimicrobiales bacterium]
MFFATACGESDQDAEVNSASGLPVAHGDAVADLPSGAAHQDPLQWVFAYCMADQRAASSSPDSMESHAMAFRACRDFVFRLPVDQQRYHTCLQSHGVDADPRLPPIQTAAAASKTAVAACKTFRPTGVQPADSNVDVDAWLECLTKHDLVIDTSRKPNYDSARAAALACQSGAPIFHDG